MIKVNSKRMSSHLRLVLQDADWNEVEWRQWNIPYGLNCLISSELSGCLPAQSFRTNEFIVYSHNREPVMHLRTILTPDKGEFDLIENEIDKRLNPPRLNPIKMRIDPVRKILDQLSIEAGFVRSKPA